ncbi:hypothetical protein [Novosphingobium sp. AP12]|uniref:hypothetical protein n=1 Tax=Novosphingobium sp. AP12 TaxID=1144305 RepID=UPI0012F83409|nr:hypothetical protein [Novosphingobium sp. AP12]
MDHELADHAERLHGLAASRTGTRDDLIRLRDIMPSVLERFRAQIKTTDEIVTLSEIRVEDFPQLATSLGIEPSNAVARNP